ncbi:MAG TPA: hypothetical protein VGV61_08470 [Thermoanaerobaculia bacterium]|jgi:hypothetical protein|nr:hypothetical protein [Thermoanaerobaculia bacterium]
MSPPDEEGLDGALADLKALVAEMLASRIPEQAKPEGQDAADEPSAVTPERADSPTHETCRGWPVSVMDVAARP